ncbi:MAG: 2-oxoacid:ferredoxin oxidoreductase subunit beta [Bacteroidales bacterium]|jgi:2-oxoglutarate ferredoxin oxidoreductase subunit beta|nr:2-oxoacid:ferredoxin oxidoreductase subunit beta [Bacteroidales bacterium]
MNTEQYTPQDFKSDQYVRWCPGCGDYAVLNSLHKAMSMLGIKPHETAVISGIGCSSRLPYYMNTYGFHTIHGRAAAIATGVKLGNPCLSVWQITGDGDCLAIGGNHFIHTIRRNIDINIILLNNKIYGLTKGQYSPTSDKGFVSKSSPYGTVEEPFRPGELTVGARGNFFARTIDVDLKMSAELFAEAGRHKGASVVEVLQNCVIYNDSIHKPIIEKDVRAERTIFLEHGKPMIFGKNSDKGLALDGFNLKTVRLGENGITEKDILVHDAQTQDNTLHYKLATMGGELPVALGVIRKFDAPTYDEEFVRQINEVQAENPVRTLRELLLKGETWEIK